MVWPGQGALPHAGVTPAHLSVTLRCMPTAHRRHAVTETEDITAALDVARAAWPELADKPGALLRRLILAGEEAVEARRRGTAEGRRRAIERTSGTFTGVYGSGYLEEVRQDWPE